MQLCQVATVASPEKSTLNTCLPLAKRHQAKGGPKVKPLLGGERQERNPKGKMGTLPAYLKLVKGSCMTSTCPRIPCPPVPLGIKHTVTVSGRRWIWNSVSFFVSQTPSQVLLTEGAWVQSSSTRALSKCVNIQPPATGRVGHAET